MQGEPHIRVHDVTLTYGNYIVMKDISFSIRKGEIFVVMGGSGCGKSTLMKIMLGLMPPEKGDVFYNGVNFWESSQDKRNQILENVGILYQKGALWSSMTLAENVALPLEEHSDLGHEQIREIVSFKLSLVGLTGFEEFYPSELSGGMIKRAALARAMALDPDILFFDEPSAGLDPVSSRVLDDLILEVRDSLKTTVVVISHDLESIFAIADNSVFLDLETRTMTAAGNPRELLEESRNTKVCSFLTRGKPCT
ncbi:MAG TPA: ATP-binding cassette domain-containing protein [Deltaproteobacteria bacterium]|nr:ATP-binding cassette domain-containing protein [Deltaproteobacteria bacterium]